MACQLDTKAPDKNRAQGKDEPGETTKPIFTNTLPASPSGSTRWQEKSA